MSCKQKQLLQIKYPSSKYLPTKLSYLINLKHIPTLFYDCQKKIVKPLQKMGVSYNILASSYFEKNKERKQTGILLCSQSATCQYTYSNLFHSYQPEKVTGSFNEATFSFNIFV